MLEPMSAASLGALVTTICIACSACIAVVFKGMSHSRCTRVHACCFDCDRTPMTPEEIAADPR